MATRQHGGSNQQNISQLNAKRGGRNYLLSSLPPVWTDQGMKPPCDVSSIFGRWLERVQSFREPLYEYRRFIRDTPAEQKNLKVRNQSREFVQQLVDEVLMLASTVQRLEPGWSAADCELRMPECLWLDPGRADTDEYWRQQRATGDWIGPVRQRFGQYLNDKLSTKKKPMGDPESSFFASNLHHELVQMERELRDER